MLEVVFTGKNLAERWTPFPSGQEMVLEQIQHSFRKTNSCSNCDAILEEVHRFRFNGESIEYLSDKPIGKYDGGNLFFTGMGRNCMLHITCSWRGKGQLYTALLLPKQVHSTNSLRILNRNKKCLHSDVFLRKMEFTSLESGCMALTSG